MVYFSHILAGGTGERLMRGKPKPCVSVRGKMIVTHCLEAVGTHPQVDAVQIVADEEWREIIYSEMPEAVQRKFSGFSKPGLIRQHSIMNGSCFLTGLTGYRIRWNRLFWRG